MKILIERPVMNLNKIPRIGIDLDGVVAQHDFGGFLVRLRKFKENLFKKKISNFYYPATSLERWIWQVINKRRKPFVDKENVFKYLKEEKKLSFYLVTSRFKFMETLTYSWLEDQGVINYFNNILMNLEDSDPDIFKLRVIKEFKLDFFIDDDLETLNFIKSRTQVELFWVVPKYRNKKESKNPQIIICNDFTDALKKLDKIVKNP